MSSFTLLEQVLCMHRLEVKAVETFKGSLVSFSYMSTLFSLDDRLVFFI